jgi:hypothetical protein
MSVVGGMLDGVAVALATLGVKFQPTFTRSRVQYLTTHHYYSIEKVRVMMMRCHLIFSSRHHCTVDPP